MDGIAFLKMHGLGNDFVIVDARARDIPLSTEAIRRIADRHVGVGCDQMIRIERSDRGDAFMRIWNPDGSEAQACGNATRCVARLLIAENGHDAVGIETVAGLLACRARDDGQVVVDMGPARCAWRDIPLAHEADTLNLDLGADAPAPAVAVNIGNPHACALRRRRRRDRPRHGRPAAGAPSDVSRARQHQRRTVEGRDRIRARVWERSAGATLACGSAACATVVAAVRRGLTGREAIVALPGGELAMTWREDGHVLMAGPVALAFRGTLDDGLAA